MNRSLHRRSGFSLVEVALALLVASVGLMAVMGMFPASLDLSKKSQDDTQFSLFAEEILNGVRALASSTNIPWSSIDSTIRIPVSGEQESTATSRNYLWDNAKSTRYVQAGTQASPLQVFSLRTLQNPDIEEVVLRYRLTITDVSSEIKRAVLMVVPGPGGSTTDEQVYMTEIHRGDKP